MDSPGKRRWTGNETVLDALNDAKGFLKTADPKNIRLVRPGREGKPARVYKVDYEAILERGEIVQNYQLFPGDRLIVSRNPIVQTTIEIEPLRAPIQTVFNTMLQQSFAVRGMTQSLFGHRCGDDGRARGSRQGVGRFWWKIAERPPGPS